MAAPFVVGSGCQAFLDGLQLIHGTVSIDETGGAVTYKSHQGNLLGFAVGDVKVSINTPKFKASPLDVVKLANKLTQLPGLLTIVDKVNASTTTLVVGVDGKKTTFDPSKAAEQDWSLVVASEPLEV